ncbi:MAG: hypothetical protein AB1439_10065 [candidate division FCPU426 bacterium]
MESRQWVVGTMAVLGLLVAAGCAQPPEQEKGAAQTAMQAALQGGAETYAMAAWNEAKTKWDAAEQQMQQKVYAQAKVAYLEAKAAFDSSLGQVEAGKQSMIAANQTALAEMEKSWSEATALSKKAMKKMSVELKQAWTAESKMVDDALKTAKDNLAAPAEIKQKLDEVKALVDKWLGELKK